LNVPSGHRRHDALARCLCGLLPVGRRQQLAVAGIGAREVGVGDLQEQVGLCAADGRAVELHVGQIGTDRDRSEVISQPDIALDEAARAGQRLGVLDVAATGAATKRQAGGGEKPGGQGVLRVGADVEGRKAAVLAPEQRRRHAGACVQPIGDLVDHMHAHQVDGLVALHAQHLIVQQHHRLVAAQRGSFWRACIRRLR